MVFRKSAGGGARSPQSLAKKLFNLCFKVQSFSLYINNEIKKVTGLATEKNNTLN